MPLYKFKVYFEDNDEVYRVIEVKHNQTFNHFHEAILASVGFDNKHDASFYMSDDNWRKGEQLTTKKGTDLPLLKDSKLNAYINDPHQKILYMYDFDAQWWFNCELTGIVINETPGTDYPNVLKSVGKAPKQYNTEKKIGEDLEEDEFEYITRNLLAGDVSPDELGEGFGSEGEEEESEDEESDSGLFSDDEEATPTAFDED